MIVRSAASSDMESVSSGALALNPRAETCCSVRLLPLTVSVTTPPVERSLKIQFAIIPGSEFGNV